jgi:hypothetical protein
MEMLYKTTIKESLNKFKKRQNYKTIVYLFIINKKIKIELEENLKMIFQRLLHVRNYYIKNNNNTSKVDKFQLLPMKIEGIVIVEKLLLLIMNNYLQKILRNKNMKNKNKGLLINILKDKFVLHNIFNKPMN